MKTVRSSNFILSGTVDDLPNDSIQLLVFPLYGTASNVYAGENSQQHKLTQQLLDDLADANIRYKLENGSDLFRDDLYIKLCAALYTNHGITVEIF